LVGHPERNVGVRTRGGSRTPRFISAKKTKKGRSFTVEAGGEAKGFTVGGLGAVNKDDQDGRSSGFSGQVPRAKKTQRGKELLQSGASLSSLGTWGGNRQTIREVERRQVRRTANKGLRSHPALRVAIY